MTAGTTTQGRASSAGLARLSAGGPAELRLVCFPFAGGARAAFRGWVTALPGCELLGHSLPGRGGLAGLPPRSDWTGLGQEVARELAALPILPTVLYGHSLGAAVAYETARALERDGRPPVRLIVAARGAPGIPAPEALPPGNLELLDLMDRRYGAVPAQLRSEPELLAALMPVLRADLHLAATHVPLPGPPLECPVTVVTGTDDRTLDPAQAHGWAGRTRGRTDLLRVEAGHLPMDRYRDAVVRVLQEDDPR